MQPILLKKFAEVENNMADISGLPTKTVLTAVENIIHDVGSLV